MNAKKQLNRRDAIARLLAIGAGGIGTLGLVGSITAQRGPGFVSKNEIDPLAVLKSPSAQEFIQPTGDFSPLRMAPNSSSSGRPVIELADTILFPSTGFRIFTTETAGRAIVLETLSTEIAIAAFLLLSTDGQASWGGDFGLAKSVQAYDRTGISLFGSDALIFGDDGTIAGVNITTLGFLGTNFDLTHALAVANGAGATCSISAGSAGTLKGVARPDHSHLLNTSALGTPSAVGLVGARGSLTQVPRFDHAHKGIVSFGFGRVTGQTGAATVFTGTVGAADGSFRVSPNVNITTFVAGTFTMTVAYTDETNTARTLTLNFSSLAGAFGVNLTGAGPFEGVSTGGIRCKASTTITIATVGTFTSLTYNAEAMLEQLA